MRDAILCLLRLNIWAAVCAETTCITPSSELQCSQQQWETLPVWRRWIFTGNRAGSGFWPHRLPQTVPEHAETAEIRASKSKQNKQEMSKKRYKQAKKVFSVPLGPGDRAFEPHYSDQKPQERVAPGGFSLFIAAQNFSIDCYQHSAVLQSCNSVKYEI